MPQKQTLCSNVNRRANISPPRMMKNTVVQKLP